MPRETSKEIKHVVRTPVWAAAEILPQLILRFGRAMHHEEIADIVRHAATDAMLAHRGFLYVRDLDGDFLEFVSDGRGERGRVGRIASDSMSTVARAFRLRHPVVASRSDEGAAASIDQLSTVPHPEIEAVIAVPLLCDDSVEGVLLFTYLDADSLDEQRQSVPETISAHAAMAVERARRIEMDGRDVGSRLRALAKAIREPLATIQVRAKGLLEDARAYGHETDRDRASTMLRNVDRIDRILARFIEESSFA